MSERDQLLKANDKLARENAVMWQLVEELDRDIADLRAQGEATEVVLGAALDELVAGSGAAVQARSRPAATAVRPTAFSYASLDGFTWEPSPSSSGSTTSGRVHFTITSFGVGVCGRT